jgi:hypothetical protein
LALMESRRFAGGLPRQWSWMHTSTVANGHVHPARTPRAVRGHLCLPPPLSVTSRRPLRRRLLQAGPEPAQSGRDVEFVESHIQ